MTAVAVIAKECRPGHAKTRLHPPYSLAQAAEIAQACVDDTLDLVRGLPATRRILFHDGPLGATDATGFEVLDQPGGGLDARLGFLFDAVDEPLLLIGMDTPHAHAAMLAPAFDDAAGVDAWLGLATDGGFWALWLRTPDGALLRGVPMSEDDTGARQLARLRGSGLAVGMLPEASDIDTADDLAPAVAAAPGGRLARVVASLVPEGTG
ncbi:TIGR04282 family arsenosugar biosynthesis glycosyltransferase [Agromyces sp. SYSU T00194]|uniref:TIGR04282 family arsenosugar biosynthesis glycosyltransferase n=1 Tax=Agromyces chitinivorans TaxID=3158560 RepID=UPI00339AD7D6